VGGRNPAPRWADFQALAKMSRQVPDSQLTCSRLPEAIDCPNGLHAQTGGTA